jgi:hypothetical protein
MIIMANTTVMRRRNMLLSVMIATNTIMPFRGVPPSRCGCVDADTPPFHVSAPSLIHAAGI